MPLSGLVIEVMYVVPADENCLSRKQIAVPGRGDVVQLRHDPPYHGEFFVRSVMWSLPEGEPVTATVYLEEG